MLTPIEHQLLDHFASFISNAKKTTMEQVLAQRTRYVTVVLEDIFQPHNASAVIRTCDCFGVQDLHIIENRNPYILNPNVTQGASKWIDLRRYNESGDNTQACYGKLREQGYRIYATSPSANSMGIQDIPINEKIALIFGTELEGLSSVALAKADATVRIPMYGFTKSFNISVCAALCLHTVMNNLRKNTVNWGLSSEEKEVVRLAWYRKTVRNSEILEKEFRRKHESDL